MRPLAGESEGSLFIGIPVHEWGRGERNIRTEIVSDEINELYNHSLIISIKNICIFYI